MTWFNYFNHVSNLRKFSSSQFYSYYHEIFLKNRSIKFKTHFVFLFCSLLTYEGWGLPWMSHNMTEPPPCSLRTPSASCDGDDVPVVPWGHSHRHVAWSTWKTQRTGVVAEKALRMARLSAKQSSVMKTLGPCVPLPPKQSAGSRDLYNSNAAVIVDSASEVVISTPTGRPPTLLCVMIRKTEQPCLSMLLDASMKQSSPLYLILVHCVHTLH